MRKSLMHSELSVFCLYLVGVPDMIILYNEEIYAYLY